MAKSKTISQSVVRLNNAKSTTTFSKTTEPVVVDGRLEVDEREANPGVIVR